MVYLEIRPNSHHSIIIQLNKHLNNAAAKTFALFYMEECGPCKMTRPEWSKLQNVLSKEIMDHPNIAVIEVDKDTISRFPNIKDNMEGFPTIQYMTNKGNTVEKYDDAILSKPPDRSIDSFVEWIEQIMSKSTPHSPKKPTTHHRHTQSGHKQRGHKQRGHKQSGGRKPQSKNKSRNKRMNKRRSKSKRGKRK